MNKQTPALIILIPGFPKDEADTTCLPAQQLLVKAFNKLYPELRIIIVAFQYPFTASEYLWNDNLIIPLNGNNKSGISRLKTWLLAWRKLKKLKQENNIIGVFSCWCGECALVGKYFSSLYKLKHFIWICGQDARPLNKLVKYIKPKEDSLIAISDFLVDEFYSSHKIKPAHVIPIGIDTGMFSNSSIIYKNIDVIGVGSLITLKQYDIFIDVVKHLQQQFPAIKTMICGNGPEKEKLQKLINDAGLQQNIELAGEKPHTEILALMQRSKILLHPSSYEGFGGVCMEALYAGAHVISFCRPMYREIDHWHIVKDKNAMQTKVNELLSNNETTYASVLINDVLVSTENIMQLFEQI